MKQNIMKNRDRSVWFRRLFIMTQRMSFILAPSHYSSLGAKPGNLFCQVTLLTSHYYQTQPSALLTKISYHLCTNIEFFFYPAIYDFLLVRYFNLTCLFKELDQPFVKKSESSTYINNWMFADLKMANTYLSFFAHSWLGRQTFWKSNSWC